MISIITPSFGQIDWLRLALASVFDQEGVDVEHIVQDAGSKGIDQLLSKIGSSVDARHKTTLIIEKDSGMYDAVNRGLQRSGGEICAYLNCDEQYLPGALSRVVAAFQANPQIDVLLAGTVVVDGDGQYLCSRPALIPQLRELQAGRMYNLTSSIFFHSRLFRDRNFFFDPTLRIVGDLDWLRRVMAGGARVEVLNAFTSTFSDLGTNLALSQSASVEIDPAKHKRTLSSRISHSALLASHRLRRVLAGHYSQPPFDYSIYTLGDDRKRKTFRVEKPTGVWRNRL